MKTLGNSLSAVRRSQKTEKDNMCDYRSFRIKILSRIATQFEYGSPVLSRPQARFSPPIFALFITGNRNRKVGRNRFKFHCNGSPCRCTVVVDCTPTFPPRNKEQRKTSRSEERRTFYFRWRCKQKNRNR